MKKTLITLLALAGVAAAASSDWTCDPTTIKDNEVLASGTDVHTWDVANTTDLTWANSNGFSIAFTLDVTSLDMEKNYAVMSIKDTEYKGLACVAIQGGMLNLFLYNGTAAASSLSLTGEGGLNATSSITLVLNRGKSSSSNNVVTGGSINLVAYADGNFDNGKTLNGRSSGFYFSRAFTQLHFGGSTAGYTGNANTLMPSNADAAQFTLTGAAYMTGGVATTEQLKTYYQLVPEPTTACLSLLALAGLAARRRRR